MKDLASVYIEKAINGKKIDIFQISTVFNDGQKFKFITRYVQNPIRQAWEAVSEQDAFTTLYNILSSRDIILHNDSGVDLKVLNERWLKYFNQPFNNKIYDVSAKAKALGIKKTSVRNLTTQYQINIKNVKNMPSSVTKAQHLFLIAVKMFNIGK